MAQVSKLILVISLALFAGCEHKQIKDAALPAGSAPTPATAAARDVARPKVDSNIIPFEQLAQENKTNISKLTVGISKSSVVGAMGTKSATAFSGQASNPFRTEAFQDKLGAQYEILYYVTEDGRPFQAVKKAQLTPLIVKNGALIGWGTISLRQALGQTAEEVNITIDR